MIVRVILCLLIAATMYSCGQDGSSTAQMEIKEQPAVFKVKSSKETGVVFTNELRDSDSLNIIEYLYYYNGGGVGVGDINGDGLEDIYFAANEGPDQLYLNKGNLSFENVSKKAGISTAATWSTGVSMADYTGDGHIDIYVCKVSGLAGQSLHNELYVNNGDGTFTEKAAEYGLDFSGYSTQAAVLDYDGDGDLDIYLLNHAIHSVRSYGTTDKRTVLDPVSGDRLFENRVREAGLFVDVTKTAGIYSSALGYGLAVSCADINGDGHTDIYIGNDFHENDYLYLNNGDKTFTESISELFLHTTQFSMGSDIADINNDGRPDIFTTDMLPYDSKVLLQSGGEDSDQVSRIKRDLGFEQQYARNHLQLQRVDGSYTDVGYQSETFATDWSWSVLLEDFDNDLHTDIFITNGIVRRPNDLDYINYLNTYDSYNKGEDGSRTRQLLDNMPTQPLSNILFRQLDPSALQFSKLEESMVGAPTFSTGAAYADLDLDGDLDIVTNNISATATIMENVSTGQHLAVRLRDGDESVHGAKVTVKVGGHTMSKELQTTRGFMSSSSHDLHFGLASATSVDSVLVTWPDRTQQLLTDIGADTVVVIEKQPNYSKISRSDVAFAKYPTSRSLPFQHGEDLYYDDLQEKLIPELLSTEGPAFLTEDVNKDGIVDVYIGGAAGQAGVLYYGTADGSYRAADRTAFEADAKYEDVAAAVIDFDKDGDLDLYVVSGGNAHSELSKLLEDRLYLNNDGVFLRVPLSLPHTNGSIVSVADYDGDGYEDIFVGARSIPGSYGLSPYSFVLKNMDGKAVSIALRERMGMVTDGLWHDMDMDGDLDLLVCGDWMPITIYDNSDGELTRQEADKSLSESHGLWNAITVADINKDGKPDIIAANAGTNHKWKATVDKPVLMYVGDYDGNGASESLIFHSYFGRYIPHVGLDQMTSQLPKLKKKFRTYESYGKVSSVENLFEDHTSATVETRYLYELRSMVYVQSGDGYIGQPLPTAAQSIAVADVVIEDDYVLLTGGGFSSHVTAIGSSGSPVVLRLLTSADGQEQFVVDRSLPLPSDFIPRTIGQAVSGDFIIAGNDSKPLIIRVE